MMSKHNSPLRTTGLNTCLNSIGLNSGGHSKSTIKPRNNHHYNISYQNFNYNHLDHSSFNLIDTQPRSPNGKKNYDYLLKFLLVGDSDVGIDEIVEILSGLDNDSNELSSSAKFTIESTPGVNHSSTTILIDGKRVKIQLWNASGGQGRFSTIIRSYSRGAQGIILVYDITNNWSFKSLSRWLNEVEEHAPGIPKILIGNRLHLAFKRQVNSYTAENYAIKHNMSFFEISPLVNYNIRESFVELSRIVLKRHGMDNLWKHNSVLSLQEICCRTIVSSNTVYTIESLPIPNSLKYNLKSYLSSSYNPNKRYIHSYNHSKNSSCINHASFKKKAKSLFNSMFKLNS